MFEQTTPQSNCCWGSLAGPLRRGNASPLSWWTEVAARRGFSLPPLSLQAQFDPEIEDVRKTPI